jgi:hypothetical protein
MYFGTLKVLKFEKLIIANNFIALKVQQKTAKRVKCNEN